MDIILLHGAIGASDQLIPLSNQLTSLGYKCHLLDFSGHGRKSIADSLSIEQFSNELNAIIESKNLVQPHVFGYSMGGYVALYLANKQPERLGKIITLGTKFHWNEEIAKVESKKLNPEKILEKVPKFAAILEKRHGSKWKELLHQTALMMEGLGKEPLLTVSIYNSIANKVLIGLADSDEMVSLEETVNVRKAIQSSSMFILPSTKHPIETVNIDLLSSIIENFIRP
ncbi:MAG: alpha/beta fold hydrolase [Bacteroidia bacterium]